MTQGNGQPEPEIIPPGRSSGQSGSDGSGGDEFEDLTRMFEHPMTWPRVTYGLYAIAIFTGIPMLVGLIVAYVARAEAPDWLRTHYTFMIRTFWYFIALALVSYVLMVVLVGFMLFWLLPVWVAIRVVRGWMLLENQKPVPNPESWLFS